MLLNALYSRKSFWIPEQGITMMKEVFYKDTFGNGTQYRLEVQRKVQRIMEFKEKNHLIKMMTLWMKGEILRKINCFHKILYVFKIQPTGLRNSSLCWFCFKETMSYNLKLKGVKSLLYVFIKQVSLSSCLPSSRLSSHWFSFLPH